MPENPDDCLPQAFTDFIFDLYDSVTLSQLTEEQQKLYQSTLPDLSQKYFGTTPWPTATSIASECNGDPLFLAIYRELTHRHWHSVSRPTLTDRMEGWDVYAQLFDECLDADHSPGSFFLLPVWVFEILHEFVYQFQGFCQIRTAVYSAARKQTLVDAGGNPCIPDDLPTKHANLADNLQLLHNNKDAWDVEMVFSYLHRLIQIGMPAEQNKPSTNSIQPVNTYFALFGSVALSRLECLLGDYTASLQALDVVHQYRDHVIHRGGGGDNSKDDETNPAAAATTVTVTVTDVLHSVFAARVSLSYHAGISYLQLRRYKDAAAILQDCAGALQRGFKTGALRQQAAQNATMMDQFNKQYDRIQSLLGVLQQICPGLVVTEESVVRNVREKYGSKMDAAIAGGGGGTLEEWFQSPKFIAADPGVGAVHRRQVEIFNQEVRPVSTTGKKLRSYLKLYTSLPVSKLASFHDQSPDEFLPALLSYKVRLRQVERGDGDSYSQGSRKTALDIHYYIAGDMVHVDEAEIQRRFEAYFLGQVAQNLEIQQEAAAIDPTV